MDIKKVVAILVTGLNDMAEELEKLKSAEAEETPGRKGRASKDDDDGDDDDKPARGKRAAKDDDDDKPARGKGKGKDEEEEEEEEDDDEPSEADIAKAARGALKVLEKDDVVKLIKKFGKADRATEVKASLRQAVIDALEEAIEEAK